MPERLHRQRRQVAEQETDSEKRREQVQHQRPERRLPRPADDHGRERDRDGRHQPEGRRRQRTHAVAADETGVAQRCRTERDRQHREVQRKPRGECVLLLQDLLDRAQVADERAIDEAGGHRVPKRHPVRQDFACRAHDVSGRERPAARGRQRLFLAPPEPHRHGERERQVQAEDASPSRDTEHGLAKRRRDDGHEDEDRHHERHDPGHHVAFEPVAHERNGHRPGAGDAEALQDTAGEQDGKGLRRQRQRAAGREQCQTEVHGGLSPHAVRHRAVEKLAEPESQEQQRDDELHVVVVADAERRADGRQRRQDHVDRQRHERRQRRHQRHELHGPERGGFCPVHAPHSGMDGRPDGLHDT